MKPPSRQTCRGFTRTELVVVMVVIGVLLWLLIPYSGTDRRISRREQCLINLKQIGLGLALYCYDYTNAPPSITSTNLARYIGGDRGYRVFHCPSDNDKKVATNAAQFASNPGLYCSYWWYLPVDSSQGTLLTPLIWDRGVCEPGGRWPKNSPHEGKGGNVLWSDGHVSWCLKFPTNRINSAGVIRW